jgi:hypothetical protein
MISFSNINKQYGKQLLFVDASFQLNRGESGIRDRTHSFSGKARSVCQGLEFGASCDVEEGTVCSGRPKRKRDALLPLLEHAIAYLHKFRVRFHIGV